MNSLPDAEYVVIGGGAVGLGAAYAMAMAGLRDILLLEAKTEVGSVTTAQGAGLCGQVRDSPDRIRLAMHSVKVFRELQQSKVKPDWREVGSLRIALSPRRAEEFCRLKKAADAAGLETHLLDQHEAAGLWPLMDFAECTAILWCPTDGCMTPRNVAMAYEHACRTNGVRVVTGVSMESIEVENGRVTGVGTNHGRARCRYAINAAGAHAYHVAKLAGLELPIVPVRHEYYVTVPMEGLTPELPCFRVPERTLYGRVRDNGLLLGGWEPASVFTDPRTYRITEQPPEVVVDWPVLNGFETSLSALFPASRGARKSWVGKGWPTFTPDGRFIIGESRRVRGFVMAGGCNAHGISGSGGIGKLLVESLLDPHPSEYVRSLSPDRFSESEWNWDAARIQAQAVYETYYGV
jgi:glycine/D-amino acid oxidase-like deaminating enzyme